MDENDELIGFENDIPEKGEKNEILIDKKRSNYSFWRRNRLYILILCTLLIIGLIIFLILFLSRKKEKDEEPKCDMGEEEKCLTCNGINCASCNIGYKLIEGKCILNYSFKATYDSKKNNSYISLINENYLQNIVEMNIDGRNVESNNSYIFPSSGKHTVYMLLDIINDTSLEKLFYFVQDMVSISFS